MKYDYKMKRTLGILLIWFSSLLYPLTEEKILNCSSIEDNEERLECFDTLATSIKLSNQSKKAKKVEEAILVSSLQEELSNTKSSEQIIKQQKETIVSLENKLEKIKTSKTIQEPMGKIEKFSYSATIVSVNYFNYKYRFKLDNGESWQLSDSGKRARLKKGEKIVIIPGYINSFFIKNSNGQFRARKINL